jgi:hypothetical protein
LPNVDVAISAPAPTAGRHSSDLKWIAAGLPVLLILLIGRYDWSKDRRPYSTRAYWASACLLIQLLPAVYYTIVALTKRRRQAAWITAILLAICTLPYRWLGLAGTAWWSDTVYIDHWWTDPSAAPPTVDWLPSHSTPIPREFLVFALLLAAGAVGLFWAGRGRLSRQWFKTNPAARIGTIAFLMIAAQSWLHLSMRAPYTYLVHYSERAPEHEARIIYDRSGRPQVQLVDAPRPHGWWHLYLFPDHQGAVHADYEQFRACEELFQGTKADLDSGILRRMLTFYVSSQFVCFFNPYYVFLFLNTACWMAAVMAGYAFARRRFGERAATVFALFIAGGCGFIFFVNQPMSYISGYAAVMVLIYLFDRLIVRQHAAANVWLFGLLFGLGLLVGDLGPMVLFFLAYSIIHRAALWRTLGALAVAGVCYGVTLGFLSRAAGVPGLEGNLSLLSGWNGTGAGLDQFYILCLQFLNRLSMDMIHAFLILPILPAALGLAILRRRRRILTVAALAAPAVGTVAFLHFSQAQFKDWPLAALPRLAYIAYPAVYLLAAIGLTQGVRVLVPRHARLAAAAPWVFLTAVFLVNNIDVLGIPAIYYHFYFGLDTKGLLPFGQPGN